MKLYCTPGGQWAGTEKDWKAQLKAEGIDPKNYTGRKQVDVPVAKADLMEFLTFHNVNVISPRGGPPVADVAGAAASPPPPAPAAPTTMSLDALFEASPVTNQLRLAVLAIDNATAQISAK